MSQQPAWLQGPPTGQGTKILCIVAVAASVLSTITERSLGIGASDLSFDGNAVLDGQLWRVFTYPFIMPSPFNLLLSLFIFWLFGRSFESQWGTPYFLRFVGFATIGAVLAVPINLLLSQCWRVFYSLKIRLSPAARIPSSMPSSFTLLSSPHVRTSCSALSFPSRRVRWSILYWALSYSLGS